MAEATMAGETVEPAGSLRLRVHNTLTRAKDPFVPLDPKNIRMYVCGPTVYDFAHIGNARPVIVFDVLFRVLRHFYGEAHVTYARNLTDIDDKINARAFERWTRQRSLNDEIRALTETTAAQFQADVAELGVLTPALVNAPGAPARLHEPRATEYVCDGQKPLDMVRVIERLMTNGYAYAVEEHVLFHVPSMPGYGALARRPRDEMLAGARVDVAPYKRDPMDFVLWKPSDPDREPGWESPWGFGRPGWHIECSAMSGALFGEVFDIHAGGIDLIFPHHENEIAQSCCAFGRPGTPNPLMARYWMHNGFLQVEGQKMSKSLGNFITIRQLLSSNDFGGRAWHGDVLRLAMLRTHYRQPIDWTTRGLEETERMLLSWLAEIESDTPGCGALPEDFVAALADDLNTPAAIAALHKAGPEMRTAALRFLGFTRTDAEIRSHARRFGQPAEQAEPTVQDLAAKVEPLIVARLEARRTKDFKTSDRLRDELLALGVEIMDAKDKTTGELSTTWRLKP